MMTIMVLFHAPKRLHCATNHDINNTRVFVILTLSSFLLSELRMKHFLINPSNSYTLLSIFTSLLSIFTSLFLCNILILAVKNAVSP